MENLLYSQNEIIEAINKLSINFNKDGAERKSSVDYFNRRLQTLESYWKDFESNHVELSRYDIRRESYLINRDYEHTMSVYKKLKTSILKQQEDFLCKAKRPAPSHTHEVTLQQETTKPSSISAESQPHAASTDQQQAGQQSAAESSQHQVSRGVSSRFDDMLRKQYINFKAFSRTVANIDLEEINEKWEFEDTLKALESRWAVIDTLHWEIEAELNGDEEQSYQGVFLTHEGTFCSLKRSINRKMWAVSHREKSTPVMDIPTFTGSFNQWTSFKDLFHEAVHNNPSISSAQKMQFLKSKLRGEAESLIKHMPVGSENYLVCWEILNNRYNNKKLIFSSHMNSILSFSNIQQQSMSQIKRFHDIILENLHAIKNLGVDISIWDPILVHLLSQKLDADTHSDYIESLKNPRELPELQPFIEFLEVKFTTLEASHRKQDSTKPSKTSFFKSNYKTSNNNHNHNKIYSSYNNITKPTLKSSAVQLGVKCLLCKADHFLYQCDQFIKMPHDIRMKIVNQNRLCKNCLFDHNGSQCFSTKTCRNCQRKHHTLLHDACLQGQPSTSGVATPKHVSSTLHVSQGDESQVLLATALVHVTAADGSKHTMRALVDQGSQISLITENAAQRLGIKRRACSGVVFGVGAKSNNSKGFINIEVSSVNSDFNFNTEVLIMNNLIKNLPTQSFTKPTWSHLNGVQLADPEFNLKRPVDLLFGAEVYSQIILSGILKGDNNSQPIVQQTRLGWIICGSMLQTFQCNVVLNNIDEIKQFWNIEDINDDSEMTSEDQECLQFYENTTVRQSDGRYVVRLPIKRSELHTLGDSKNIAIAQFLSLEKRLSKQHHLAEQYKAFIAEYRDLGHMEECSYQDLTAQGCYLPHHCVQPQMDCGVNKFRVVFNASSKTSTGVSINDVSLRGPNLQKDLQSLIIKWRQYQFVVTGDLEKMYRQIKCHTEDQAYQKIVWRDTKNEQIKSYKLATITYGMKAAPFLAMRTLHKLAEDERSKCADAAKILKNDLFMDDLLTGFHSIKRGQILITNLNNILKSGRFTLRKWASNSEQLIENIEQNLRRESNQFNFKSDSTKTLGLSWNVKQDKFTFKHQLTENLASRPTKRVLLSEISKIFDPLGWLAPVVTNLKVLFQKVWQANLSWDDVVPDDILVEWTQLREDIENIEFCEVPRWIGSCEGDCIQLHGFCDASLRAYACVVYARVQKQDHTKIVLIAAKTKLVPQTQKITLPRLELSGAQLLSKLMHKILNTLNSYKIEVYGWCDSKIVLGWLQGDPGRWKPFVSNRVKLITPIIPKNSWRYVKSLENPADYASRGQLVSQLSKNCLWWEGPTWLNNFEREQEQKKFVTELEIKKNQVLVVQNKPTEPSIINELLLKHSSIRKITSIIAWTLRALTKRKHHTNYLTLHELREAKRLIIKYVQRNEFSEEFKMLTKQNTIKTNSKLINLNPFIDKDGIMKVGGRLEKSQLKSETKHPAILPHDSCLTTLLIEEAHLQTFHGGASLTATWLRQRYWIVGGNRAVKKQLRKCVPCRKHNPQFQHQLMGTLPEPRTTPAAPFYHTGADLTGFVDVKSNRGRGIKTTKGYIVLLICMVTKAVHIELVSDLSSVAFLSALRRMAARRGAPHHIYSDNGTNFIKGNRNIQEELFELAQIVDQDFLKEVTEMNIEWHFQAPSWPSASGLWERAIRSLKGHLKPVIGEQKLTFEEYSTLLAQIEACLNSRPLWALSEDPEDLEVLTPSHFLTCRADLTIIETEKDARTRWQLIRKLLEDLWKRWKTEYLTQLTVRSKWFKKYQNISIGDIVCIHEEHLPPGKWSMGRVVELHPGSDGIVRVVSLKTKNGIMKRPVLKLSVLPVHQTVEQPQTQLTSAVVTRKPKFKRNIMSILFSMILFLNILTNVQSELHTSQFNISQGLYFDKISNLQVIRDEWKLVVYYEMDPFWQGSFVLNKYIKQLEQTCSKLNQSTYCNIISTQLHHGYSELQYYNVMLLSQHDSARPRRRRGLINGVGYLSNYLFGVLDERFAEQYQRDISQIRIDQHHLASLWRNQTSIVEAEYNLLKRTAESMDNQHKSIHKNLHVLEQSLNNLASEININHLENEVTLGALAASNMLHNLKEIQGMLLDLITDIYHGKFNFHLITPEQLLSELSIISTQLPSDLSLPIENIHNDLRKIYSILKIKTRISREYLLFEIRIPLILRDNYELYKLIPIPILTRNNTMRTFIPRSQYVAINLRKDTYITITEHVISECLRRESDTYLCYLLAPIEHLTGNYDLCESADSARSFCRFETAVCSNMWVNLNNINTYMYFCCQQCTARLYCGRDQVTSYHLARAGIAVIPNDCMLKTDDFLIYPHKLLRSTTLHVRADVIAPEIPPINHLFNLTLPLLDTNEPETERNRKALEKIDQSIQLLKEQTEGDALDEVSVHDIHHYTVIYILLAVVIAAGAALVWRRVRRRWRVPAQVAGGERAAAAVGARPDEGGDCASASASVKCVCQCESDYKLKRMGKQDRGTVPDRRKPTFTLTESV